jgi:uncharacterized repeat protein (TIGR01451 family)
MSRVLGALCVLALTSSLVVAGGSGAFAAGSASMTLSPTSSTVNSGTPVTYTVSLSCGVTPNCAGTKISFPSTSITGDGAVTDFGSWVGNSSCPGVTRTVSGGVVTFNYGTIATGVTQCTFTVTPPGYRTLNGTQVTISPTLSGTNFTSSTAPAATITVKARANGAFSKGAPVSIGSGAGMQYTLNIGCGGSGETYSIESLTVTDQLPANFTYVSSSVSSPMPGAPSYDAATRTLTYSPATYGPATLSVCNGTITVNGYARTAGVPDPVGDTISNTASASWTYFDGTTGSGTSSKTTKVVAVVPNPFLSKNAGSDNLVNNGQYTFAPDGKTYPYTYPGDWDGSGKSTYYEIGLQTSGTSNSGVTFDVKDPLPCLDTVSGQVYSSPPVGGPYCASPAFVPRVIEATGFTPVATDKITVIHPDGTSATIPYTPGTGWVIPASPAVAEIDFPTFASEGTNTQGKMTFRVRGYAAASAPAGSLLKNTVTATPYLTDLLTTPVAAQETATGSLLVASRGTIINTQHGIAYDGQGTCTTSSTLGNGQFTSLELSTAPSQAIYFDWLIPAGATLMSSPNTGFTFKSQTVPTNVYTSATLTPTIVTNYNGTGRTLYRWVIPAGLIKVGGDYTLVTTNNMKLDLGAGCAGTYNSDVTIGYGTPVTACYGSPASAPPNQKAPALAALNSNGSPISNNYCGTTAQFTVAPINPAFSVSKSVQGNLDSTTISAGGTGQVSQQGGSATYNVSFDNTGSTNLTNPVLYDLLPRVGDTEATSSDPRGSQYAVSLTGVGPLPAGVTVFYSTATNPCRPEVRPTNPGCVNDWSATAPSPLSATTALKFVYTGTVYVSNSSQLPHSFTVPYAVSTPNLAAGETAWNTVGSTATAGDSRMAAAESTTTGLAAGLDLLSLVKTADTSALSSPPRAGDTITYHFRLKNNSNVTMTNVSITDPLVGLSALTYAWPGTAGTLASGQTVTATATYQLTQADVDAGDRANTAVGHGTPPTGPAAQSDPSSTDTPLRSQPTLSVAKSSSTTSIAAAGQVVPYSFLVTNTGNVTLTTVSVTDALSAPSAQSGLSSIVCPATTLAPAASMTCTASYQVTQADLDNGSVTDTATAQGTPPGGAAPVQSSPSALTIPAPRNPAITLDKDAEYAPGDRGEAGDTIQYEFTATNSGNVTLTGVTISDPLPGLSTLVYTWPGQPGVLAPGQSVVATASYTVTQQDVDGPGEVTNTATATGTGPGGTQVTSQDTATLDTPADSGIQIAKSGHIEGSSPPRAGDIVRYRFDVTNLGVVTLHNVNVADAMTGLSDITLVWPGAAGVLAPGATVVGTANYTLTQADVDAAKVVNTATTSGLTPSDSSVTDDDTLTIVIPVDQSALSVVKSSTTTVVTTVDQVVPYSFVVTNTGNVTLTDVRVNDLVASPSRQSRLSAVECADTVLAPAASTTCTATYRVTQADLDNGSIGDTATSLGTPPGAATSLESPSSSLSIPVSARPALTVVKSSRTRRATEVGQRIRYSFRVTNRGNVTLTDLAVGDRVAAPSRQANLSEVRCPVTTLAPGASTTCTATYTVTLADLRHGTVRDTARATGMTPGDHRTESGPSALSIRASAAPKPTQLPDTGA